MNAVSENFDVPNEVPPPPPPPIRPPTPWWVYLGAGAVVIVLATVMFIARQQLAGHEEARLRGADIRVVGERVILLEEQVLWLRDRLMAGEQQARAHVGRDDHDADECRPDDCDPFPMLDDGDDE